jgi:hypothetical protein
MENYIGCKIIKAEPMGKADFNARFRGAEASNPNQLQEAGYHVQYPPDGYHSWSPKDVFENAYRKISEGEMNFINPPEMEDKEPKPVMKGE